MMFQMKFTGSIATIGFVVAVVCAVLYFMALPIFDEAMISWLFVCGLVSCAIAVVALILRMIWDPRA